MASDHLAGTQIYGNPRRGTFSQSGHWSINFEETVPGYDEFLLATGDCSNWLIMKRDELVGSKYDRSGKNLIALWLIESWNDFWSKKIY